MFLHIIFTAFSDQKLKDNISHAVTYEYMDFGTSYLSMR